MFRKLIFAFLLGGLFLLYLVFPKPFQVKVLRIASPDVSTFPIHFFLLILIVEVVRQNVASILMDVEVFVVIPNLVLVHISIAYHYLIPKLFIVPVVFHFTKQSHQLVFSPVNQLKVSQIVLEYFKDHITEIDIVRVSPLFDDIAAILIHFNHNLDSIISNGVVSLSISLLEFRFYLA